VLASRLAIWLLPSLFLAVAAAPKSAAPELPGKKTSCLRLSAFGDR
jgi:hypothetical protein